MNQCSHYQSSVMLNLFWVHCLSPLVHSGRKVTADQYNLTLNNHLSILIGVFSSNVYSAHRLTEWFHDIIKL